MHPTLCPVPKGEECLEKVPQSIGLFTSPDFPTSSNTTPQSTPRQGVLPQRAHSGGWHALSAIGRRCLLWRGPQRGGCSHCCLQTALSDPGRPPAPSPASETPAYGPSWLKLCKLCNPFTVTDILHRDAAYIYCNCVSEPLFKFGSSFRKLAYGMCSLNSPSSLRFLPL